MYVDETAFTRIEGKKYGFAPKGQRLEFRQHKPGYTIGGIAAVSEHRLEGLQLRDGSGNKYSFMHFLIALLKKLQERLGPAFDKVVLYLDNASYHTCSNTMNLLEILGVSYIFAPAYLSPVNPIEYFFGVVKKRLRRHHIINK